MEERLLGHPWWLLYVRALFSCVDGITSLQIPFLDNTSICTCVLFAHRAICAHNVTIASIPLG